MDGPLATMNLTWVAMFVPFVTAAGGAYLGSYFKKKGENLATHEDINKLVDQVRAVTTTTKEIEAKISGDLWDRQKQWELKRDILFDAAKRLSEVENKLLSLYTFWRVQKAEGIQNPQIQVEASEDMTAWQKSCSAFEETGSLVMVSCSEATMKAFGKLINLLHSTAAAIVNGDEEMYTRAQEERTKKLIAVKVQIRKELGLKLDPPSQSSGVGSKAKDGTVQSSKPSLP
jgi:hypothetical protein